MSSFVRLGRNSTDVLHWLGCFLSVVLLLPINSFAQLSTASLNGTVRDPTGAVVPNANVILRNVDTGVEHTTISNRAGAYLFLSITPGRYTVETSSAGFAEQKVPEFALTVGQTATVDFAFTLGAQNTVVTVSGAAPQLDASSANLGTVIGTRQVNDLPLNGRDFTQLLTLTPGTSPVNNSQASSGYAQPVAQGASFVIPAINGQGNRSNYFFTDGLSNFGSFHSVYAVPPIIDAIQEFKVVSHADSAEYGSVTGGVVNVVTKSGTNELHGSGWEFARNAIFDARTYFLPKDVPKTYYSQNQFGGAIGGPVVIPKLYDGRNKTFFFGAYQGFRYTQTSNTPLKVPTAAQLAGDESDWPTQIYNPFSTRPDPSHPGQYLRDPYVGNQIPVNPQQLAYANFIFPAAGPVFDASGDNALDTTPLTQTINEWTVRVDQKIGANDSAWFRYSSSTSVESASGGLPGLPSVTTIPNRNYGGSYVHVFSPSLIFQVEFGRTTVGDNTTALFTKGSAGIISQVGFSPSFAGGFTATVKGGSLLPSPGITGYSSAGENISLHPDVPNSNQYSALVTKTFGNHELHIGGGYISNKFLSPISSNGLTFSAQQTGDTNPLDNTNTGDPLASFLLNVPDGASRANITSETRPGGVMSAFIQDSWRATPKLTLNFGVRYDVTFIPPYGTNAQIGQEGGPETGDIDFTNGTYIVQKLPPPCSVRGFAPCIPGVDGTLPAHVVVSPNGKLAENTYTNVGPHFGFAYRWNDKTVVHGGFGVMYDNWSAVLQTSQNIAGLWPDTGHQLANNLNQPSTTSVTPSVTAQDPFATAGNSLFPAPAPFNQVGYEYDPHNKNPYSEQFNFGVQQLITSSTTATLNYVGALSRRLDVAGYYNTALTPGPGDPQARSLYPYIAPTYYDRSVGSGNYNALQFSLEKRYTRGLSIGVAYTWSKAMNIGGDGYFGVEGGVPQNPYNPGQYDYSVAGFDLPQILSVNTLYDIPVGKGKSFSTGNGVLDYILGNWQINDLFQTHSGIPFTPVISSDISNTGNTGSYEHLNRVGNPGLSNRGATEWFNTAAFATPAIYTYGDAGRNSLRTAPYWDLDMSVFRQFPIGEGRHFEFRAEAFNLLNNVVFGQPNNDLNSGREFGTINSTANTARQIQLGGKFIF